jgi:hypothetical protein
MTNAQLQGMHTGCLGVRGGGWQYYVDAASMTSMIAGGAACIRSSETRYMAGPSRLQGKVHAQCTVLGWNCHLCVKGHLCGLHYLLFEKLLFGI